MSRGKSTLQNSTPGLEQFQTTPRRDDDQRALPSESATPGNSGRPAVDMARSHKRLKLEEKADDSTSERISKPAPLLPIETLHSVFAILLGITDNSGELVRSKSYFHTLYNLRTVCKYWNDTIIRSGRFWALVDLAGTKDGISMVLRRSANTPLKVVCWSMPKGNFAEATKLLEKHAGRIVSFEGVFSHDQMVAVRSLVSQNLPSIQQLSISCLTRNSTKDGLIPDALSTSTELRHLLLSGISPTSWDHIDLSGLRSLVLSDTSILIKDMSALLSRCTALETLLLDAIDLAPPKPLVLPTALFDPNSGEEKLEAIERMEMPSLRQITLRRIRSDAVAHLLGHFDAPFCNTWQIELVQPTLRVEPFSIQVLQPFAELVIATASTNVPLKLELRAAGLSYSCGGQKFFLGANKPLDAKEKQTVTASVKSTFKDDFGISVIVTEVA